jgi:hypothetical protein
MAADGAAGMWETRADISGARDVPLEPHRPKLLRYTQPALENVSSLTMSPPVAMRTEARDASSSQGRSCAFFGHRRIRANQALLKDNQWCRRTARARRFRWGTPWAYAWEWPVRP